MQEKIPGEYDPYPPFAYNEPKSNFWCALHRSGHKAVMYTVNDFSSFLQHYKYVMPYSTDKKPTLQRRYELYLALSKVQSCIYGNHLYGLKKILPAYAKKKNKVFEEDLIVLYKLRLLHIFSEELYDKYFADLSSKFNANKKAPR